MSKQFAGVFIEGDRQMTPFYPSVVSMEMLRALAKGQTIYTGTNEGGVEHLVRLIADEAEVPIQVVEHTYLPEDQRDMNTYGASVDWDARHKALPADVEVFVIHVDHQDCRESRSALATLDDDRVRMWSPIDATL